MTRTLVTLGLWSLLVACVGPGKPASQTMLNENRNLQGVIRAQEIRIEALTRQRNDLERQLEAARVGASVAAAADPGSAAADPGMPARTERVFERFKSDSDVEVEPAQDGFRFVLRERVLFGDSTEQLTADGRAALQRVADELRGRGSRIVIEGHTDNVDLVSEADRKRYPRGNIDLSVARALKVWAYLEGDGRILDERMTVVGYGPNRPRLPNDSERNRYRNRRVEILVTEAR